MKKNDWERRFGAARRAIDRKLLADCERQIAREGQGQAFASPQSRTLPQSETAADEARIAIARAFGRPLY